MTKEKDGPAFPLDRDVVDVGMTLRDYFAAKAMQGIVAAPDVCMGVDQIATWAYTQADAMLKAREQ